jgi:hypothetical protein
MYVQWCICYVCVCQGNCNSISHQSFSPFLISLHVTLNLSKLPNCALAPLVSPSMTIGSSDAKWILRLVVLGAAHINVRPWNRSCSLEMTIRNAPFFPYSSSTTSTSLQGQCCGVALPSPPLCPITLLTLIPAELRRVFLVCHSLVGADPSSSSPHVSGLLRCFSGLSDTGFCS